MAEFILDNKEVIRIKVKKYDGKMEPECKKFSIDPQITSFEMLQSILARAFEITSDFTISYMAHDSQGQDVYLSMMSDWDMDAAFQCAAEPYLQLRVDLQPSEELEDWEIIAPVEIPQHEISGLLHRHSLLDSITDTITHSLGKTVDSMQRAIGLKHAENGMIKPVKAPVSDTEFCNYLDSAGFMVKPSEFRLSVYQRGIEPSFRHVAWRHLLNIYPAHMSHKDRFNYLKHKEEEYKKLRDEWCERLHSSTTVEEVKHVVGMVRKDVLRTDRTHNFYAGRDDNKNTSSLFHILVTYALTHPDISYCQGMSDIASPLLFIQKNEAQAYICFCALMNRLGENFSTEGNAMMTKFDHLLEMLYMYDPDLYTHLLQNSGGEMFFCYRWFLLELKREFPFNDALLALEVMWATLPPSPPEREIALVAPDYSSRLLSISPCSPTFSFQQAMYVKLLAMHRVGALHQVTQSAKSKAIPIAQASANNNLSPESSPCSGDLSTDQNIVSSFDASSNDGEDGEPDFPKVDNSRTCSLQQKFDNLDHIFQKRHLFEEYSNDNREDHTNYKEHKMCANDTIRNNSGWAFTNSCLTRSRTLENSCLNCVNLDDVPIEKNRGFHSSHLNCELDADRRSWSFNSISSESSETYNHLTHFTLDLNTNNSTDISSAAAELKHFISSTDTTESEFERDNIKYVKSESQNIDCSRLETNQGLFQNTKHPLASPRWQSDNSTHQEVHNLLLSSSKSSTSPAGRHLPVNLARCSDTEKTGLTKNMSGSHISDCQEATEEFESTGNACSSFTNLPVLDPSKLPPPQELGAGNPFLMFLCLTLLIQHRETILSQEMCYEEIAMHFDRLVRRHNVNSVLHLARQLYTEYLRAQQVYLVEEKVDEFDLNC